MILLPARCRNATESRDGEGCASGTTSRTDTATPPHPSDEVLATRIFPKVVKGEREADCWVWTGAGHARSGHGMFGYNALGRNHTRYVHRWVYEYLVEPIADGKVIDHLCRNTRCCNPQHLEVVTPVVNTMRGVGRTAVNARKRYCKRGARARWRERKDRRQGL